MPTPGLISKENLKQILVFVPAVVYNIFVVLFSYQVNDITQRRICPACGLQILLCRVGAFFHAPFFISALDTRAGRAYTTLEPKSSFQEVIHMRKSFGAKPLCYPQPVFILAAYDENGVPNAMNAAWGMICNSDRIALFIDEDHKTTQNLLKAKAFTVSIADRAHMDVADFFGIATGNKMPDKFERTGYHASKSGLSMRPSLMNSRW